MPLAAATSRAVVSAAWSARSRPLRRSAATGRPRRARTTRPLASPDDRLGCRSRPHGALLSGGRRAGSPVQRSRPMAATVRRACFGVVSEPRTGSVGFDALSKSGAATARSPRQDRIASSAAASAIDRRERRPSAHEPADDQVGHARGRSAGGSFGAEPVPVLDALVVGHDVSAVRRGSTARSDPSSTPAADDAWRAGARGSDRSSQ